MTSHEPSARRERPSGHRWLRLLLHARVAALLSFVLPGLAAPSALADDPADVVPSGVLQIPEAPRDFIVEKQRGVTWSYHASSASIVRELKSELPRALRKVA